MNPIAAAKAGCFALVLIPNGAPQSGAPTVLSGYPSAVEAAKAGDAAEPRPTSSPCSPVKGRSVLCDGPSYVPIWREIRVIPAPEKDCTIPTGAGFDYGRSFWRGVAVDTQGRIIISPESGK